MKIISLGENEKNENIPLGTIMREKSCCLREDIIKVAYLSSENPLHACPVIRILSPFRMIGDAVFLYSPVKHIKGRPVLKKNELYLADIILIQRATFFSDHSIAEIKGPWQKTIYEIDDLLIDIPRTNPYRKLNKDRAKIIGLIKDADAVTVSTERLKKHFQSYNRNINVIPNYIDPDIWNVEGKRDIRDDGRISIAFIGTPTHNHDLNIIVPAIKKILATYKDRVVFRFFGCITDELKALKGVEFSYELIQDYRVFAKYIKEQKIDIALAPLVNNEFNRCKSNIKFLEYAICRLPGIYSRIHPYTESIRDGETGILCDYNTESWYAAIKRLIENENLRRSIADKAYQEVKNKYLLDRQVAEKWYSIIKSLKESTLLKTYRIKTKKGNYSIRVSNGNNQTKTLHSIYDPVAEASAMVAQFNADENELLVVLGLGLGYHLKAIREKYKNARIIVIEGSPEIFFTTVKSKVISDIEKSIDFIVGYPPAEAIKEITVRQLKSGLLPLKVFPLPSALSAFPDYYRPIYLKLRDAMTIKLDKRLKYQKFSNEQLTICLLDFGYFLRKEIHQAIKALGHNVVSVTGNKDDSVEFLMRKIVGIILKTKPDFILTVNHLGFDEEGILSSFLESIEMPVVVWYVDSPNIIVRPFRANISDNTVLFLWDWSCRDDMVSAGFKNIFYLPLATDETIFKPIKISKGAYRRYYSKVSFVGNSMVDVYTKQIEKVPETLHKIVETLAVQLSEERVSFKELLSVQKKDVIDQLSELTEKDFRELESAVYWRASMLYRWKVLRNLVDFSPVIYGDEGWKKMIDNSFQLRGTVNYYETLPVIYNSTEINFNTTSLQMPEAVNQRVFDVPACGGFLLTDHQKAIEELFELGREVITYTALEEIPELVRFYLKHPSERERIAMAARERILKEHTYRHRVNEIIKIVKGIFR